MRALGRGIVIGLIAPQPASPTLEALVEGLQALGYRVLVEAASRGEAGEAVERLARAGADVVVVPGGWPGQWDSLGKRLGVPVVRGAWSPGLTLEVIARWGVERLSPLAEAEKALGPDMARLAIETLNTLRASPPGGVAFSLAGLPVPLRPPPMIIVSEVYVRECSWEGVAGEVYWRLLEGADVVSLGWDGSVTLQCYWGVVEEALERLPGPVAADPGSPELAVEAAERGAHLALSLTAESLESVPKRLREEGAFVVLAPGGAEGLRRAAGELGRLGFERAILDPVARPAGFPGALEPLCGARAAGVAYPLMLGINNIVELLDADTTGSTALSALLAAEAGVSVIMVGEESFKARGGTWEAWMAAGIASLSLYWRKPPKDLGLDLLVAKRKAPGGPHGKIASRQEEDGRARPEQG
jgi:dihydropteroate synthase-like protein